MCYSMRRGLLPNGLEVSAARRVAASVLLAHRACAFFFGLFAALVAYLVRRFIAAAAAPDDPHREWRAAWDDDSDGDETDADETDAEWDCQWDAAGAICIEVDVAADATRDDARTFTALRAAVFPLLRAVSNGWIADAQQLRWGAAQRRGSCRRQRFELRIGPRSLRLVRAGYLDVSVCCAGAVSMKMLISGIPAVIDVFVASIPITFFIVRDVNHKAHADIRVALAQCLDAEREDVEIAARATSLGKREYERLVEKHGLA